MSHTYLKTPAAPSLPLAPREWDARYQDQFANVLRLYFNQLSYQLQQLSAPQGGHHVSFPTGAFSSTVSQTAASTTTAYVVTLNAVDFEGGISLVEGSKLTAANTGVFNFQFSLQLANNDTAPQDIDVWFRKNGVDIPNSNSRFGLAARKSAGDPFHTIGTVNLFVELMGGDYIQLVWRSSSANASITAYPAGTSPTRPAIPSVILTVSFVSAPTE